ncbi:MAG: hypothetical protein HY327_09145 [Chloroflexi bacterium]|nr:hypothetical protein [Chloroflexota bacterium]
MSVRHYAGKKYIFEVDSEPVKRRIGVTIIAIDRASGHYSHINTLNAVLSQFDFKEEDPRMDESDWLLTPKEWRSFQATANGIFRSKRWLSYIESALDDDRMEGEWANVRPLK